MGATSLKRKARKNRVVSKRRQQKIKLNTAKPVIKKIDLEKIKEEFAAKSKGADKKETKAKAKAEEVEAKAEETPKQETTEEAPKASKKKEDKEDQE